jgi:hypothetical protein
LIDKTSVPLRSSGNLGTHGTVLERTLEMIHSEMLASRQIFLKEGAGLETFDVLAHYGPEIRKAILDGELDKRPFVRIGANFYNFKECQGICELF